MEHSADWAAVTPRRSTAWFAHVDAIDEHVADRVAHFDNFAIAGDPFAYTNPDTH